MCGIPNIDIKMRGVKSKLKLVHRGANNIQNAYTGGSILNRNALRGGLKKSPAPPPPSTFLNGIARTENKGKSYAKQRN